MVPLKNNPTVCYMCILLYVIYYQINYFFYTKMHCYFSFQWCTLKRKSYWLREKTLPQMDRASSSNLATQKSERGKEPIFASHCSAPATLHYGNHSFFNLPTGWNHLLLFKNPPGFQHWGYKSSPVDWAATECEASPEYRQTLLHSPAHTVHTNLMHAFVIYIRAAGSLRLENAGRYAQPSWVGFLILHISTQMCCLIIGTKVILLQL